MAGDRLLATGGAQEVEGQGGGGVVPWALIAGYGTRDQVGGSAFYTHVHTGDFDLDSYGAAVGIFNRVELSVAKQDFDAGSVIPGLKLKQNIFGAKVRVFGDAVYDKDNDTMTIPTAIGAKNGKRYGLLHRRIQAVARGTRRAQRPPQRRLRDTRANQMGLLGFGRRQEKLSLDRAEVSGAVLLTDNLALGAEYRWKPDNLSAFRKTISVTCSSHGSRTATLRSRRRTRTWARSRQGKPGGPLPLGASSRSEFYNAGCASGPCIPDISILAASSRSGVRRCSRAR